MLALLVHGCPVTLSLRNHIQLHLLAYSRLILRDSN